MDRFVAIIPARGGSKSIPLKNIKLFCGKPLLYWSIKAAQECRFIESIFVATENEQIRRVVEEFNLPKVSVIGRGKGTATDTASTESVMMEFAAKHKFDHLVLIQATSPLLEGHDLDRAIDKYTADKADSLLSVVRQKRFIWKEYGRYIKPENYDIFNRPMRQGWSGFLVENGAFYITSKKRLLESGCRISGSISYYEMREDSYFELDEPSDWIIAEELKIHTPHRYKCPEFRNIKLLICDVDGVLTDGGMYYSSDGEVLKKYNARDGKGIELIRKNGIKVMLLTSENSEIVKRRADKLKVDYLFMGVLDKRKFLAGFFKKHNSYSFNSSAYIGDDINDVPSMKDVCFSAAPIDAMPEAKRVSSYISSRKGGAGCVREICDLIVQRRNSIE